VLSIPEEAASLALERNGERGKGAAVAEAFEVAISPSLKPRSCIRGLWSQVSGRDGGASGVVETSSGILRLAGNLWQTFRELNLSTVAVFASLTGHQDSAGATADRARRTFE
jgi:hypothetical protein